MQEAHKQPEWGFPKEDLRITDEQFAELAHYAHLADILKGQGAEGGGAINNELLYRFRHLLKDADHMEERGYNAQGYRVVISGMALGALTSPIHQGEVLKLVEQTHLLTPKDRALITELNDRITRLKENIPEQGPTYNSQLFNQLLSIREEIQRQGRKNDPTAEALELMSSALIWTALSDTGARTSITDEIGRKFRYQTRQP